MATYYGSDMLETSKFFALCNRFFDCLNVRSLKEDVFKRNPDLAPYRSQDDPRFQVYIVDRVFKTVRIHLVDTILVLTVLLL